MTQSWALPGCGFQDLRAFFLWPHKAILALCLIKHKKFDQLSLHLGQKHFLSESGCRRTGKTQSCVSKTPVETSWTTGTRRILGHLCRAWCFSKHNSPALFPLWVAAGMPAVGSLCAFHPPTAPRVLSQRSSLVHKEEFSGNLQLWVTAREDDSALPQMVPIAMVSFPECIFVLRTLPRC